MAKIDVRKVDQHRRVTMPNGFVQPGDYVIVEKLGKIVMVKKIKNEMMEGEKEKC